MHGKIGDVVHAANCARPEGELRQPTWRQPIG